MNGYIIIKTYVSVDNFLKIYNKSLNYLESARKLITCIHTTQIIMILKLDTVNRYFFISLIEAFYKIFIRVIFLNYIYKNLFRKILISNSWFINIH